MPKVSFDDCEFHYETHGDGPPLLLIAGLGGACSYWGPQVEPLGKHFKVIMYDHRGTGRSTHHKTAYTVDGMALDRSELYFAAEAFVCGTGQEILPVTSIDKLPVGDGKPGPITAMLRQCYFDVVRGNVPDHPEWRTLV